MDEARWQAVQEIFSNAVDLPEEEQHSAVLAMCGEDATLLTDVMELLQEDKRGQPLLDAGLNQAARAVLDFGPLPSLIKTQIGPYRLDAHLDGTLLVFTHRDMPGLIGFIGTTFGRHGVNIAQMNVGRKLPGGEAIGVVNLDSFPPKEALDEVAANKDILSHTVIRLPEAGEMPTWLGA